MVSNIRKQLRQLIREAISLDIKPGDVILTGRFKNKRKIVKTIGKDKYGQPTINGKSILKFKIEKEMPKKKWSAKSRQELKEVKDLRKLIRNIILEGPVKDSFEEKWYNVDQERNQFENDPTSTGTHHKDNLKQLHLDKAHPAIDELFENKRDLKRLWNEIIDENNLRDFWEGPKMKYFHSLSYYGSPNSAVDKLSYSSDSDEEIQDLSGYGFFQKYNKSGNKDEMSTYGIYDGNHQIPISQTKFGVLISGRVTLATMDDAFTESRSKATDKDRARHIGSGMPKRIMIDDDSVSKLLFEEEDIGYYNKIGECILDNWSIEAVVYNSYLAKSRRGEKLLKGAKMLAKRFGVPLLTSEEALGV